jgi:phage terminase large subunit-like protein
LKLPWRVIRRPKQARPDGDWFVWLILAGRGWGKTRTGAEFVLEQMQRHPGIRAALVAQTFDDGRDVMVEGETGMSTILDIRSTRHTWNRSLGQLFLENGSRADIYSSEKPKQLRGPQHHVAWGDEPAHWADAHLGDVEGSTWSNLKLGCRLGADPRIVLTTTPRRVRLLHGNDDSPGLLAQPLVHVTRGTTYENLTNLSPTFRRNVLAQYEGTTIGRQELYAEDIIDAEGALWKRGLIRHAEPARHYVSGDLVPAFKEVVVSVDPAATSTIGSDETGIVVDAVDVNGVGWAVDDRSLRGTPVEWGSAAIKAYHDHNAGEILVESNQGGEMVEHVIHSLDPNIRVVRIHAGRSKADRAKPVLGLYEQGKVYHARSLPELEDQMCNWDPLRDKDSPDRLDAHVHGITRLMLTGYHGSTEQSWIA